MEMKMDLVAQEWDAIYKGVEDNVDADGEIITDEKDSGDAGEKEDAFSGVGSEGQEVDDSVNYSYQVVELKDMILILVQGDVTMGLYFDPVNQKFCGYNFFYEY